MWFILYLQELTANVTREQYRTILKSHFEYEKNLTNLYEILEEKGEILEEKGDVNLAISRAKKLCEENINSSPSKMAPATQVYKLVEELKGYLV